MDLDDLSMLVADIVNGLEEGGIDYEVRFAESEEIDCEIEKLASPDGSERLVLKILAPEDLISLISINYSETGDIVEAISDATDYFQSILDEEEELELEEIFEFLDEEEFEE